MCNVGNMLSLMAAVRRDVQVETSGAQDVWMGGPPVHVSIFPNDRARLCAPHQPFPTHSCRKEAFVGRSAAIDWLFRDKGGGTGEFGLSVISGMAGIGKSAVARQYCRVSSAANMYPAGVFFVTAASALSIHHSYSEIASSESLALGAFAAVGNAHRSEVRAALMTWLREHPGWLMVFDNMDDPAQVVELLPGHDVLSSGHVVITTRDGRCEEAGGILGGAPCHALPELSEDAAVEMMLAVRDWDALCHVDRRCWSSVMGRLDEAELNAAKWLASKALCGLPLALRQAAAYMSQCSMTFQQYSNSLQSVGLNLFGHLCSDMDAWLRMAGVSDCKPALHAIGVNNPRDLAHVRQEDVSELPIKKVRQRMLWAAVCRFPHDVSPFKFLELRDFLCSKGPQMSIEAAEKFMSECGLWRLDHLRDPLIGSVIAECETLKTAERSRLQNIVGSVPMEADPCRQSVRSTWKLSVDTVERLNSHSDGLGPAAVQALELCALVAPDDIPVEFILMCARSQPPPEPLASFVFSAVSPRDGGARGHSESTWEPPTFDVVNPAHAYQSAELERCRQVLLALDRFNLVTVRRACSASSTLSSFSLHRLLQSTICDELPSDSRSRYLDWVCRGLVGGVQVVWTHHFSTSDWYPVASVAEVWCMHGLHLCASEGSESIVCQWKQECLWHVPSFGGVLDCTSRYLLTVGQPKAAKPLAESSLRHLREVGLCCDVAETVHHLGIVLQQCGEMKRAGECFSEYSRLRKQGSQPADDFTRARALDAEGSQHLCSRRIDDAVRARGEAVAIFERLYLESPHDPRLSVALANARYNYGTSLATLGCKRDIDRVIFQLRESIRLEEQLWGESSSHPDAWQGCAQLGGYFVDVGRPEEGVRWLMQALEQVTRVWGDRPHSSGATVLHNLAFAHMRCRHYADARRRLLESQSVRERILGGDTPSLDRANAVRLHGDICRGEGNLQEALNWFERSVGMLQEVQRSTGDELATQLARVHRKIAGTLFALGPARRSEAELMIEDVMDTIARLRLSREAHCHLRAKCEAVYRSIVTPGGAFWLRRCHRRAKRRLFVVRLVLLDLRAHWAWRVLLARGHRGVTLVVCTAALVGLMSWVVPRWGLASTTPGLS